VVSLSISSAGGTDGSQFFTHTHSDQEIPQAGAGTSLPHQEASKGLGLVEAGVSGA
jgi:hypothetical protein